MKTISISSTVLLLFACFVINAQQLYNNQVILKDVVCQQKGDQIQLNMNIDASKADVPSRQSLIITPIIQSKDGTFEFPPVVINGKNRHKANKRAEIFHEKVAYSTPYIVVRSSSEASSSIGYTYSTTFQPWMKTAKLNVKEEVYGCATCEKSENTSPLAAVRLEYTEPIKPEVKPLVSFVQPMAEPVKNRNMQGKAYLEFPVGKADILTDFRNNFKELSKIQEAINQLKANSNAVITSINLKGFASPEGSYSTNEKLSEQRAQALKKYLQNEYNYPNGMFNVTSVAEDWDGLRALVEASGLDEKQAILNVIDDSSDKDAKERKLKTIKGGSAYRILLQEYFPQLRYVDYRLNFTIRAFSVEEGKEIVKTSPGQMSLNEMFLVANTYPKGSDDFNQVFDIAVRMFPTDVVANINAAAIVLGKGDIASAHRYLDPYQQVPQSWNNQGIMYMLEGNYTKAQDFLAKAQQQGVAEAGKNLELLKSLQDYQAKKKAYDEDMRKEAEKK